MILCGSVPANTNHYRRYQDKSSAKHNLDDFLKNAYSKQIKELNGTTGLIGSPLLLCPPFPCFVSYPFHTPFSEGS